MKKFAKSSSILALIVICCSLFAAARQVPGPAARTIRATTDGNMPPPLAPVSAIKGTYITSGRPFLTVPAVTYTLLDPGTTVNCPGTTNCTLLVSAFATSAGSSGRVLCTAVDGAFSGFTCPYIGDDSTTDEYSAMILFEAPIVIGPGNHSVSIYAYSDAGDNIAYYRTLYQVFKP